MAGISKQSGAWATDSQRDLFHSARIKLTLIYAGIVAVILVIFSMALYTDLTRHVRRQYPDFRSRTPFSQIINPPLVQKIPIPLETFAEDTVERVATTLIILDLIIFGGSVFLSYALAGYTLKPIRSALDAQAAFSADASHELRTPLAVMRNDIEVLLRGDATLPKEVRDVLKSNLEEINKMTAMTEQLLQLARSEALETVNFTNVDLNALISSVFVKFQPIAAKKEIKIRAEQGDKLKIKADAHAVERAVGNLIQNAIVYTKEGGEIIISLKSERNYAIISVADNGIGIPKKDLDHIFDRFYKAANGDGLSGNGLGLAIVKKIAQQHNGSVHISSTEDKGTEVFLRLPKV